jgi:fumarylacetoacetate (FAA) hydrolase
VQLVSYQFSSHGKGSHAGVVDGDAVLNAARLLGVPRHLSMLALLELGPSIRSDLARAARAFADTHRDALILPEDVTAPRWLCAIDPPLPQPRSFRDFYAYEAHVAAGYRKRNRPIPDAWYEFPVFFFQHSGNMLGPDAQVPYPSGSKQLDFELEIGAIIGKAGRDIPASRAWDHVAGLTILNDWSARDTQAREMSVGLGPAKGKDFATSLGPAIVTLDELEPYLRDDRHHLSATVMINDVEIATTDAGDLYWTLPQMIERASHGAELQPGDVIGLGTMGNGCLLELGETVHPWLEPGDEIVLTVEGLGRLRNMIGD